MSSQIPTREVNQRIVVEEKKRAVEAANHNATVSRIVRIVYFLSSAIGLVLFIRLVLALLAVNPANVFASIISTLSTPFVAPFATLVQNPVIEGAGVFELTTVIAMVAWGLVGWFIGQMLWLIFSRPR